ncbi:MAG: twitching motility protein PilT [Deltaproteobacteria bacterium HGW-Deltaproteobacteria-5]|nr:MAG: twitching motility protein PilT [Deltaproteobacteria bacterium HGW-Deltaproteobacteria-5]
MPITCRTLNMNKRFSDLILAAIKQRISDLHITGGFPLIFRSDGIIHFDKNVKWTHTEIDAMVKEMLSERQLLTLRKKWSVDYAMSFNHVRVRINTFYTTRGLSLAIRLLPETIPDITSLNLHPSLNQIRDLRSGLVLVCGSTGSGKSTTVAAIIEEINRAKPVHIITIEDPIEYRFKPKKAFIEQREVGVHVPSFNQGLLDVLRENPDVIFVGELREPDTIRLTLNAAESGHLVFATLHATDAEDAIYRINNCVSGESQEVIRYQFASLGGKQEGMYTMELYQKEFINNRTSFNHPHRSFGMGAESSREEDRVSSLIDPNAVQDVVYMASVNDPYKTPEVTLKGDDGQPYVVLEDHDMELKDIIAQYDQQENGKPADKDKKDK